MNQEAIELIYRESDRIIQQLGVSSASEALQVLRQRRLQQTSIEVLHA